MKTAFIARQRARQEILVSFTEFFNALPVGAVPHTWLRPLGRDFLYRMFEENRLRIYQITAEKRR